MTKIESDCCDCEPQYRSCSSCPYKSVKHYYCDQCGEETEIYHFDGEELCLNCIKRRLVPVE